MRRLAPAFLLCFLALTACPAPVSTTDAGQDVPDSGAPLVDAGAPDAGPLTMVVVHYPADARGMALRGSVSPASWNTGLPMNKVDATTYTLALPWLTGPMELKPMLGNAEWAKGPNWTIRPGQVLEVYPRFATDQGQWSRLFTLHSTVLNNDRGVWVYLPPTYLENPTFRAPVLYMHDGQNLMDPSAAFGGNTWKVPETMDQGAADGTIAEAIVVGPENTGGSRIDEYTPTVDATYGGGKGDLYLRFLVEELKPRIDADFRTRPERATTALMGSSLGGLITAYAGVKKPEVFGLVGEMSPSTWWDNRVILTTVGTTGAAPNRPLKVYVDCGDQNDGLEDTKDLAQKYRDLGYVDDKDLLYVVQPGANHNEVYWAQRLPAALHFLLGPGR